MRLIDLHCNWLRQYFSEMAGFEQSADADVSGHLGEIDGYLSGTAAAGLFCARSPDDWASLADPWGMLGDMIARHQAEFSGRILMGPDDAERWRREPADFLCWGLIGVGGFDFLVRTPDDLDRLPTIFARGVRIFQPIATSHTHLGGSSEPGDDRGLTDLGRLFLERLVGLVPSNDPSGPRPILDLSGMNAATMADVLAWAESDSNRRGRVLIAVSHGAVAHPEARSDPSILISLDHATRLRALGGVIGLGVGPPHVHSLDELAAQIRVLEAIPFMGRDSMAGIAIGTGFLGRGRPIDALKNVELIVKWLRRTFGETSARAVIDGNGRELSLKAVGGVG